MNADAHRMSVAAVTAPQTRGNSGSETQARIAIAEIADHVVDDCFFAIGQAVGTRKTVDYQAVLWLRSHFRPRFIAALARFGNRWSEDRHKVLAVAFMLAERAVRCAADRTSITIDDARRASEDVQRYCELHSRRAARANTMAATTSRNRTIVPPSNGISSSVSS